MLISNLIRATDDVEFTACSIEGDETLVSDLREAGARVVTFGGSFKFDPRALGRMVSFFRDESFDVLHCHLPYAQTLGRLVAQVSDINRL